MTSSDRGLDPAEYIAFMRRVTRAAAKHVAAGDPQDLAELLQLRGELDVAITNAVAGLRRSGVTWQEIANVTGMTRQAAWERWAPRAWESRESA